MAAAPPLATFKYGGGADAHGTRRIGNWYSDNAVDLMAAALSPVSASENLMVTSVTRRPSTGTGVNDGSTVFATGASGERFAYLHLDPARLPKVGQRIAAGQEFAAIGDKTAGGPHLHFATQNSDPTEYVRGAGTATGKQGGGGGGSIYDPRDREFWTTSPGDAAGQIAGDVGSALIPDSIEELIAWIGNNWNRIAQVGGGFVILLVGLLLLGRRLGAELPGPAALR